MLYWLTWSILVLIIAVGLTAQGVVETLRGVLILQLHPARLITDYSVVAGPGAAMVNAALVAAIGLFLLRVNRIQMSGPALSVVYTMLGFGLFGKTPLTILPIILGVFVSARLAGKHFNQYILIALFGTALAPVVSAIAVELSLPGALSWPLAVAGGVTVGIFLPPAAMAMLRMHQGYSLYNVGMTSGFIGLFVASVMIAGGVELGSVLIWNTDPTLELRLFIPLLSVVLIAAGVIRGGKSSITDFREISRRTGRLPSDFMDMVSSEGALVNMGVLGLTSWLYVVVVGAPLNGPVLGGILTVVGFGAFGKHPRNCFPVVVGIFAATLLFGADPAAPGPILALLFGTTLAPIAGSFGAVIGCVAGFLHFVIVMRSGGWHAGLALYNNGFAGGLTATLVASVMEWHHQSERRSK
ncbi:MAG: DUF1576 domain-containing protein [Alkalispirochaeta sp.]